MRYYLVRMSILRLVHDSGRLTYVNSCTLGEHDHVPDAEEQPHVCSLPVSPYAPPLVLQSQIT